MTLDIREAATGKPEDPEAVRPLFYDALFRDSKRKVKQAPLFVGPVADTHCHLAMLPSPALSLARAALAGVSFIVTMADPHEGPERTYFELGKWCKEAEEFIRRIAQEPGGPRVECLQDLKKESKLTSEQKRALEAEKLHLERAFWCGSRALPQVPSLRIAIGCHPHYAKSYDDKMEESLLGFLSDSRTCALGEVGLDYHYDYSPRDVQRRVFVRQLQLAKECGLPVILHIREAHDDALEILRREGIPKAGALLHCCNVSSETLSPFLDLGCMVAYGGPLTFSKAEEVREGALMVPDERLLTETDAPFMTPVPVRGVTCEPAHTLYTASYLADLKGKETGVERMQFYERLYTNALDFLDNEPTEWQKEHSGSRDVKGVLKR